MMLHLKGVTVKNYKETKALLLFAIYLTKVFDWKVWISIYCYALLFLSFNRFSMNWLSLLQRDLTQVFLISSNQHDTSFIFKSKDEDAVFRSKDLYLLQTG